MPEQVTIPGFAPAFVWREAFNTVDIDRTFYGVNWRNANVQFLGEHQQSMFGQYRGKNYGKLPTVLKVLSNKMIQVAKPEVDQKWTTAFTGRFYEGDFVAEHRDPRSNINYTLILVLGEFTGAETAIVDQFGKKVQVQLNHGDMLALPCTIEGKQGPRHSVSPLLSGRRYTLILNEVI